MPQRTAQNKKAAAAPERVPRPKLLMSIVNKEDEALFKEVINEHSLALVSTFSGMGTAHSAVLDYLGVGQSEKSILLCLIPESDEALILRAIRQKIMQYRIGKGIGFTVPLSGVSQIVSRGLTGAATEKVTDGRAIMHEEDRKYDLILAAIAVNHVDIAMEAARAAGAAGGTVVRARSTGNEKAEQFIGITLMQEQEILLILSKRENKQAIMEALSEKVGLKTEARGVIFSVPVDRTVGIPAGDVEAEKSEEKENG